MIVIALGKAELGEDAVNMLGERTLGHPQTACDPGGRAALGHERERLALARLQFVERVVDAPCCNELLNERWVDNRTSSDDALDGLEKVVHVSDAALQQITASLATCEETQRMLHLHVGRENKDPYIGVLGADCVRRLETFPRLARG